MKVKYAAQIFPLQMLYTFFMKKCLLWFQRCKAIIEFITKFDMLLYFSDSDPKVIRKSFFL